MKQKVFSQSIRFNGEFYHLQSYKLLKLSNLLFYFSYQTNLIVLEHNGKISNTQNWCLTKLGALDTLETISIVGGG